jgi:DNA primase
MDRRKPNDTPTFDLLPILYEHGMQHEPRGQSCWCPYHPDDNPSASINYERTLFACHACGMSGDAIKLLRDHEQLDFKAALSRAEELSQGSRRPVRKASGRRRGLFG